MPRQTANKLLISFGCRRLDPGQLPGRIPFPPEPLPFLLREDATPPRDVGRALREQPDVLGVRRIVEPAVALEEIPACVLDILNQAVIDRHLCGRVAERLLVERLDIGLRDFHAGRQHQVVIVPFPGEGGDLGDGEELDGTFPAVAYRLAERLPPFDDPGVIGRRAGEHAHVLRDVIGQVFEMHRPGRRPLE
jgi:hypothetical protein